MDCIREANKDKYHQPDRKQYDGHLPGAARVAAHRNEVSMRAARRAGRFMDLLDLTKELLQLINDHSAEVNPDEGWNRAVEIDAEVAAIEVDVA